jgi:hypothetical protein
MPPAPLKATTPELHLAVINGLIYLVLLGWIVMLFLAVLDEVLPVAWLILLWLLAFALLMGAIIGWWVWLTRRARGPIPGWPLTRDDIAGLHGERRVFVTPLTPQECHARLKEHLLTASQRRSLLFRWHTRPEHLSFMGVVSAEGFWLIPATRWGVLLRPMALGLIERTGAGTRLNVVLRSPLPQVDLAVSLFLAWLAGSALLVLLMGLPGVPRMLVLASVLAVLLVVLGELERRVVRRYGSPLLQALQQTLTPT